MSNNNTTKILKALYNIDYLKLNIILWTFLTIFSILGTGHAMHNIDLSWNAMKIESQFNYPLIDCNSFKCMTITEGYNFALSYLRLMFPIMFLCFFMLNFYIVQYIFKNYNIVKK